MKMSNHLLSETVTKYSLILFINLGEYIVFNEFILCVLETLNWVLFANSENTDDMLNNATFHQGVHCLLILIDLQRKKCNIFWKLLPVTPQYIQVTSQTNLFVSDFTENSIGL